ncbi:MAG TPA: hypothetical protein ENH20_00200 [Candidatus Pacearchaeota archaeon]|nr:hypothetical protein [Candidatus Pacearchaeota archaeon]
MQKFLKGIIEEDSDTDAIRFLEELPKDTISLIDSDRPAPCVVVMNEGVVCHGYVSGIPRKSILLTLPDGASRISFGYGGVDFNYGDQRYSIRCGAIKNGNHYDWIPEDRLA